VCLLLEGCCHCVHVCGFCPLLGISFPFLWFFILVVVASVGAGFCSVACFSVGLNCVPIVRFGSVGCGCRVAGLGTPDTVGGGDLGVSSAEAAHVKLIKSGAPSLCCGSRHRLPILCCVLLRVWMRAFCFVSTLWLTRACPGLDVFFSILRNGRAHIELFFLNKNVVVLLVCL
jgi:hypothetical protein